MMEPAATTTPARGRTLTEMMSGTAGVDLALPLAQRPRVQQQNPNPDLGSVVEVKPGVFKNVLLAKNSSENSVFVLRRIRTNSEYMCRKVGYHKEFKGGAKNIQAHVLRIGGNGVTVCSKSLTEQEAQVLGALWAARQNHSQLSTLAKSSAASATMQSNLPSLMQMSGE